MKQLLTTLALFVLGCTPDLPTTTFHLDGPVDMAVICTGHETCTGRESGTLTGYVVNAYNGSLARLNLHTGDFFDDDAFIPGLTPVPLGGRPSSVVADAENEHIFVANVANEEITRVDATKLPGGSVPDEAVTQQALPGRPSALILAGDTLYAALPDEGVVARIPLAEFGNVTEIDNIPLSGTPYSLVASSDGEWLYVGHAEVAYLSVVQLSSGAEVTRVPLADECADGLDNDGNGQADGADWGCQWLADGGEASMPADWVAPDVPSLGFSATTSTSVLARLALAPDDSLLYAINTRDRTLVAVDLSDPAAAFRIDVNAEGAPGANRLFRRLGREDISLLGVPTSVALAAPEVTIEEEKVPRLRAYVASTTGVVLVIDVQDDDGSFVHRRRDGDDADSSTVGAEPRLFEGDTELVLGGNRRSDRPSFGEFLQTASYTVDGEADVQTHYGIAVAQDEPRVARSEVWKVAHAGAILDRRAPAGIVDGGGFATAEPAFCLGGVEVGDLLRVRYAPSTVDGDGEIVTTEGCEAFVGREFVYEITERRLELASEGFVLELLEGADEQPECSTDPLATTATLSSDERARLGDAWPACPGGTECQFGRCRATVPALTTACFPNAVSYSVHVPAGTYAVVGSTSGYLHPWTTLRSWGGAVVSAEGQCVQVSDDADFVGRATEWVLKSGATLPQCPLGRPADSDDEVPHNIQYDDLMTGEWFSNHALTFRMVPGCATRGSNQVRVTVDSGFDVRWEVAIDSSFGSKLIGGRAEDLGESLGNPRSLRRQGPDNRVYAVDAGQQKVVEISTGIDTITAVFR